jgi:hypothetical protein
MVKLAWSIEANSKVIHEVSPLARGCDEMES